MTDSGAGPIQQQPLWVVVARWVAVVPAAIVGATVAAWGVRTVVSIGGSMSVPFMSADENAAWFQLLAGIGAGLAWGFAFVWCSTVVAPDFKRTIAVVFGALGAAYAVTTTWFDVQSGSYWSILSAVCIFVGLAASTWAAFLEPNARRSV